MSALESADGLSTGMIEWASRGPDSDDDGQGFTGIASAIFTDGFEPGDGRVTGDGVTS
jgi:hypothetical protein